MNKVELIGRLTKEPELRYTESNKSVISFSIAVNKKVNGENNADFINCVAWNNTAKFIDRYFRKGQAIAVVGRLQNRSYDDSNGQKRYITEVVVEEIEFVGNKIEDKQEPQEDVEKEYKDFYENNIIDDDMPF